MKLDAERSALMVIDVQERLAPAIASGAEVVERTGRLIRGATAIGVPIVATEQAPGSIGGTVPALAGLLTREALTKTHFDAMTEAHIAHAMADLGRDILILAGMEAHICVLQTALGALALGYHAVLVADAVGSRDPSNRAVALDRFRAAGGAVVTSEMVLFEWLGRSDRPEFKPVLELIK